MEGKKDISNCSVWMLNDVFTSLRLRNDLCCVEWGR